MANGNSRSGLWTALVLLLFTALMVPAAWFLPPGWNFIALMGLMILFMITLGVSISGRPAGILIDERNLMSLSRLQMILWTLIILSAYLTIALERVHTKPSIADALAIILDPRLWYLMGISTASLIGSSLIQSTKKNKDPKRGEVNTAAKVLGEDRTTVADNRQGLLYKNANIKDAAFSDMFEGDEVGNAAYVDLAKVQMFFFTVVAALSYGVTLFYWIITKQPAELTAFPVLSGGLIAILGISHAGFLVNNSTAHTPTA